jgi:hypothetical protein
MDRQLVTANVKEDHLNTPRSFAETEIPEPEAPRKDLHKMLAAKHQGNVLNDTTADFAVVCEDQRFMAHKSVLAAACPYFARMFRFEGKVCLLYSSFPHLY